MLLPTLVSPLGLVLALLTLALFAGHRRRLRTGLLAAGLATLVFFSLPAVSGWLIATMEDRYPALTMDEIPAADYIILLGGAVNIPHRGLTRPELGPSGDRVVLAAHLWHAGKAPKILISAGLIETPLGLDSEAVYTAELFEEWGVDSDALLLETDSGNTFENAQRSLEMLGDGRPDTVLLVTSAFHMPRARALFCAAGLETVGVTGNHWLSGVNELTWSNWLPQAQALAGSGRILREYLGILVYAALGRLDAGALAHDQPCSAGRA